MMSDWEDCPECDKAWAAYERISDKLEAERAKSTKLLEALEGAIDTIHLEFCGISRCHPVCLKPKEAIREYNEHN